MNNTRSAALICALAAILAAYSNHFHNSFHFDDFHTIQDNIPAHSPANIGKFFTDAHTFSSLPTHQVYRPLLTASVAFDYARGKGQPFAFHVTTFILYLLFLATLFALCLAVLNAAAPGPRNWYLSLAATLVYALHPVSAETVNYIIQRAEILSTFGVTAGLALFIWQPGWRRYGLYLVPVVLGILSKPPALVFPFLLMSWVYLFESRNLLRALRTAVPSLAVCAVAAFILNSMTVAGFDPGGVSPALYRITQLYVVLGYFWSFLAPVSLSADSDLRPAMSILDGRVILGLLFVIACGLAIWRTQKSRRTLPIAFGLLWFLITLFPTSWMPLAELANDHRMFFPFAGLTIAAVWAASLAVQRYVRTPAARTALAVGVTLIFALEGSATYARNQVWKNEETLWKDVTEKSPANGRGLMNYGLTLMARGDYPAALDYFSRARIYTPNYFLLEINTGIVLSEMGRHAEAEQHFERALALEPSRYEPHYYMARWLAGRGRITEAAAQLQAAIGFNRLGMDARHLLMNIYQTQRQWASLESLAAETLKLVPDDKPAAQYGQIALAGRGQSPIRQAAVQTSMSAEQYLSLSLVYYQAAKYAESLEAAQQALRLKPDYPEAWNNVAAACNAMHRWEQGIEAADAALRLRPDFQLARNNRAWALSQQKLNTVLK